MVGGGHGYLLEPLATVDWLRVAKVPVLTPLHFSVIVPVQFFARCGGMPSTILSRFAVGGARRLSYKSLRETLRPLCENLRPRVEKAWMSSLRAPTGPGAPVAGERTILGAGPCRFARSAALRCSPSRRLLRSSCPCTSVGSCEGLRGRGLWLGELPSLRVPSLDVPE